MSGLTTWEKFPNPTIMKFFVLIKKKELVFDKRICYCPYCDYWIDTDYYGLHIRQLFHKKKVISYQLFK